MDQYEIALNFQSWAFQPILSPSRAVSAKGVWFSTEDGREMLDFSSCFVSHNIGHQDPRVINAIIEQAKTLCAFAPSFSTKPRALLAKMLAEVTPGDLSRSFISLGGTEANEAAVKICHKLREICDKWEILLITDEVMSGFGRTGRWFAVDHWNVVPDIMTMAKGLTSAYVPLGATVVRTHIGDRFKEQFFSHGATYAGHALACAAALALIPIYQEDKLIENSEKTGRYLLEKAQELQDRHPCVGDVRGLGLFVGLELVKNRKTKEPIIPIDAKIRSGMNPKLEVAKKLGELGMMAMAANPGNVIVMAPPLIISMEEIDEGVAIMDKALKVADTYTEN